MAELLKDMYNYESLHEIAKRIQSVYHPFQVDEFLKSTMDQSWDDLELKARVRKISSNLGRYLPGRLWRCAGDTRSSSVNLFFRLFWHSIPRFC